MMEHYSHHKRIARLIGGHIGHKLRKEEVTELTDWLNEDVENVELFNRIKSPGEYRKWVESWNEINLDEKWESFFLAVRKVKAGILFRKRLKFGAAVLLPILILIGGYFAVRPATQEPDITQLSEEMKPGAYSAVLELDNGTSIELNPSGALQLKEKDGTAIHDSAGILNYRKAVQQLSEVSLSNTIRTLRGGEYNLVLSDGTRVLLNAMSELKYPVQFLGTSREIELSGEAYFEVSRSGIPFIVRTKTMRVEVLGTSFNVNAYEKSGKVTTTLVEGKIKIETEDHQYSRLLNVNEQAVFDPVTQTIEINVVDVSRYISWKEGQFIFFNERLEDIMNTLSRWYTADVIFTDASVKELHFSGSVDRHRDMKQILEIIRSTNKVEIHIEKTSVVFSAKR